MYTVNVLWLFYWNSILMFTGLIQVENDGNTLF